MDVIPVMKPWLGDDEVAAAEQAIRSGWVAQGPRVASFETALAAHVQADHGVAVSSCTAGLHLALIAIGVGAGDDVVVPSLSFIATANAPRYVGATPVFADVDSISQNVSAETIEAAITDTTKAVIVVHQIGMPADLDAIRAVCEPRGIAIIEDAACAIGATYKGHPIGSHSDLVVFSFHPRKVLTTGEGGMIVTSNRDLAERMRRLRQHGMSVSAFDRHADAGLIFEEYLETGFNYRMTDVQAAIGLVQLEKLPAMIERRRAIAHRYRLGLTDLPMVVPADPPFGSATFQSFSVVLGDGFAMSRDALMELMQAEGISTKRGVMAAHREPAYRDHPVGSLPNTEYLADHALILPLFHEMTDAEQQHVVDVLHRASRGVA